jgi:Domain of unknown function (DUF5666)
MTFIKTQNLFITAAVSLLIACGGATESTASKQTADTDATIITPSQPTINTVNLSKPSVYVGPITGFGSVVVNGVRFSSVGASVADDDSKNFTAIDLRMGMTVEIKGDSDDSTLLGNASTITIRRGTQGSVGAVDVATASLQVMGQRVITNASTAFSGALGLASLVVGDTIEVYGAAQADGSLLASLIERKTLTEFSTKGVVSALNTGSKTFAIGSVTVVYPSAIILGNLVNGALVKIKTTVSNAGSATSVLSALEVKTLNEESGFTSASGGFLKIKGIAAAAPVAGKLTVAGTVVDVSSAAFKGASFITAGSILEVKGTWSGSTLLANSVEFEGYRESQIGGQNELYGAVAAFTSVSNFTVNGVVVDASGLASAGAASLAVGTYVEVKGNMQGSVLKASKIEFKSASASNVGASYETYGVVSAYVSLTDFQVNGLRVNASNAVFEHGGTLRNGVYVEIKGSQNASGVFVATKVEVK